MSYCPGHNIDIIKPTASWKEMVQHREHADI